MGALLDLLLLLVTIRAAWRLVSGVMAGMGPDSRAMRATRTRRQRRSDGARSGVRHLRRARSGRVALRGA